MLSRLSTTVQPLGADPLNRSTFTCEVPALVTFTRNSAGSSGAGQGKVLGGKLHVEYLGPVAPRIM